MDRRTYPHTNVSIPNEFHVRRLEGPEAPQGSRSWGGTGGGFMRLRKVIIPVLLIPLMLLLATSLVQAYSGYYYVIPTSAPLRECPSAGCEVLLTVYQGDKVEILERTDNGWSKVRLAEQSGMGWIPNNWLSYSPDLSAKTEPPYHVNISSLPLRDKPRPEANVLTMLHFNDAVEMLGVGTSGWAQVRDLQSNMVGYVPPRYLSAAPVDSSKPAPRRRAPAPKEEKPPTKAPAQPSAM